MDAETYYAERDLMGERETYNAAFDLVEALYADGLIVGRERAVIATHQRPDGRRVYRVWRY